MRGKKNQKIHSILPSNVHISLASGAPPQTPLGYSQIFEIFYIQSTVKMRSKKNQKYTPFCHQMLKFRWFLGLRPRPRWGIVKQAILTSFILKASLKMRGKKNQKYTPFCHKMLRFCWLLGLRPRPRWGAYDAPLDPLIVRGFLPCPRLNSA